jgi:hypothetical protein
LSAATGAPTTNPPPPAATVTLQDFKLVGDLHGDRALFTLTATARVTASKGGSVELLSGAAALTEIITPPRSRIRVEQDRFVAAFDRAGTFPIRVRFEASVRQADGWNSVEFRVAPSALQPVVLQGLADDTQFRFENAARPERKGDEFLSYLPSNGGVKLAWKQARAEGEGKLFYAVEMLSQIGVSPGLMRQAALVEGKVMQGEMMRLVLLVRGAGEVTRVQGEQVLAWNVEPGSDLLERRLIVRFNQPQKDRFALQVQTESPLGAFPQTAEAIQLRPEGATRFAGYVRVVNDGAVRLEVVKASGLSQISPEQFPETDVTRTLLRPAGTQRFVYRFSGADFSLRIQADQILPELAVSQVLVYHLAENELALEAEVELDVREAPLRELLLLLPRGYAIARLNASGMSDYFLRDPEESPDAELRLVYGQPVSGRQVIQLRLERNQALGQTNWTLPRVEVARAKSVRGNVGVSADAGFRLTAERTQALTEIATAFFPRKVAGIQAAFRISEPAWQATLRVERLPQTLQADAFHLFSIGEGIVYGSSVMNYLISGAPVSAFRVELSGEYFNVEFAGKDIRNWQKTTNGYVVQLHAPVSGAYTLLATFERPFRAQGETLTFTGARPLDVQAEQGYTLVISAYQFQVNPVEVSPSLLPLETGEVPPEYRLFFDAPVLRAYRYASRPFNLRLALSPLAQGDSLSQVVDRAAITTRISKEGQVLTDLNYLVKNRGNPDFGLLLPEGTQLWSATVNGAPVVPVIDGKTNLIPLPQRADPNAVLQLELKLAARSTDPRRVTASLPVLKAPVMLAEWRLEPDAGRRLVYRRGSLTPPGGVPDVSGFAGLSRTFTGEAAERARTLLFAALLLTAIAVWIWRWTARETGSRFSARHVSGLLLGLVSFGIAVAAFVTLADVFRHQYQFAPRDVTLLAPVQQAGNTLSVELANVPDRGTVSGSLADGWPALLALLVWGFVGITARAGFKPIGGLLGWTLLAWAALRWPNGAVAFLLIVVAFLLLQVLIPALRRLWQLPPEAKASPTSPSQGPAPATAALWVGGLIWLSSGGAMSGGSADFQSAAPPNCIRQGVTTAGRPRLIPHSAECTSAIEPGATPRYDVAAEHHVARAENPPALADSVRQEIRVEDRFALASAKIRWQATKGAVLPLLFEPAVLTGASYPTNALRLDQAASGARRRHQLEALRGGTFDMEVQYQFEVAKKDALSAITLPTPFGLVNQLQLTLVNLDVDVFSPQAVSIRRDPAGSNTVATLVLSPFPDSWVGWKPRSRDLKREKPVFYAEVSQLYVPSAGVIEGAHYVSLRPAQGELSELILDVPAGATITDVLDPLAPPGGVNPATGAAAGPPIVSLWRFDPDTRKLRVNLNPAQSRPFVLLIRSQLATGPLPFEQSIGLVSVENAAAQTGWLGVATGNEVQLDSVGADAFSTINLEDFPLPVVQALQERIPGLTVRRAFRYADVKAVAALKVSAVEPDVRVETQTTLSLGEDRTVLAANATVEITRAGIFRLSFLLPAGLEVESVSGPALTHWTELKTDDGRIITLHLRGKTEGQQQLTVSLAGPGVRATNGWTVPQLVLREAGKQQGTLLIVPEQGMRLQAAARDGVTQLDPQRSGIRQKGVLAFRLLQTPWKLALDIEQVDPWIQVTGLQHAVVNEAQVKITANLQYQIENTGLKTFHVYLPTNADSVRFQGEQVADFLALPGAVTNGLQGWEIKLHRRVIGAYLLQASYQTLMPEQSTEVLLRGVQAADVNLQRGFVTVQSGGRVQVRVDTTPAALQPTEWQGIPRVLQQDLKTASANLAYRLVEPAFQLPLKLERHEPARLLPGRVNEITFTSVISDNGVMLTQVKLEMLPGDKRLLQIALPKDAHFWFAFVNRNGVWPWREQDRILIPLEQSSRGAKAVRVEFYYSGQAGTAGTRALDLALAAPQFDLPLENLTWRVYFNEKWELKRWAGSLQLQEQQVVPRTAAVDVQTYLQNEAGAQREQTREAEQMLALGNSALEQGDPQQARRAFQAAYGLSQGDDAFNEDARVQLNNLKLQQALVGLNMRQAAAAGESDALAGKFRDLRARKDVNYTQQDAKAIIDRNSAEENAVLMRLAQRLIQQQDAAVSSPAALRASIPEQGRLLTFKRSVVVDTFADLKIDVKASAVRAASGGTRAVILAATLLLLAGFARAGKSFGRPAESRPD